MASAVATPLENQLSTIAGVDSMTSTNGVGTTRITLQFTLDRDIDAAAQDVQAAISLAIRFLPKNMPTPPAFRKVNPADQPVLYLALSSPTLPLSTVVVLIGIVKKNAIMMIDFALEAEREEGKRPLDAIYEGAIVRFRPIMMTTMAALMGTLPIAMGLGAGGESRQPLGLAVVEGLLTSQLLTLYITPVVYYYMDLLLGRVRPRKATAAEDTSTAAAMK